MRPLLDFDDAGAPDDHPAKGVTVGDIRAWFDEVEQLRATNAALVLAASQLAGQDLERLRSALERAHLATQSPT